MINDKVIEILAELSGTENISTENHLQNDLGLDSMLMVTLLIEIEENFNIELDESDMNPFDLNIVQDIISLVEKYGGDKNE